MTDYCTVCNTHLSRARALGIVPRCCRHSSRNRVPVHHAQASRSDCCSVKPQGLGPCVLPVSLWSRGNYTVQRQSYMGVLYDALQKVGRRDSVSLFACPLLCLYLYLWMRQAAPHALVKTSDRQAERLQHFIFYLFMLAYIQQFPTVLPSNLVQSRFQAPRIVLRV